jgi:hypothetical protein
MMPEASWNSFDFSLSLPYVVEVSMAILTLSIPDDLLKRVEARLGNNGQSEVEEYLLSVLEAIALDGTPIDAETEGKLLEGLASPLEEMTDGDWKE